MDALVSTRPCLASSAVTQLDPSTATLALFADRRFGDDFVARFQAMTAPPHTRDLIKQASELIQEHQNPSIAFLQRMLTIDYATATDLMSQLPPDLVSRPDASGWRAMGDSCKLSPEDPRYATEALTDLVDYDIEDRRERAVGAMLGLAIGDALGASVQGIPRASIARPVVDLHGGGLYDLTPGQWTGNTSQALCIAYSMLRDGFSLRSQLHYLSLWDEFGFSSSTGERFDVSEGVASATSRFRLTGKTRSDDDACTSENECIVRLAPTAIYFHNNFATAIRHASAQSLTTHADVESGVACQLLAEILIRALQGAPKALVVAPSSMRASGSRSTILQSIALAHYREQSLASIHAGVDAPSCLEAALWCFDQTNNFADCVLMAANLGEDASAAAAVAGQVAGAFYSASAIPKIWCDRVHLGAEIADLAKLLVGN